MAKFRMDKVDTGNGNYHILVCTEFTGGRAMKYPNSTCHVCLARGSWYKYYLQNIKLRNSRFFMQPEIAYSEWNRPTWSTEIYICSESCINMILIRYMS